MKKIAGIRTKTTIYILTPVIISFIVVGLVLFFSLFNSQQKFATLQFQNIASKYAANFEKKINVALDYLSTVANVLEFQIHESDVDREALQRMMYYVFDGHTVNSSSIYFEPDAYDGKDAQYINTMFGTSLSGRISYYFYRYNGRTGYRHEALENDIEFTLPFYTETKKTGAPVYSEPVILNIDGEDILMFIITYPIFRNNEFIGVITADIFLEEIYAELQAEKIFETGYVIIANDKQNLIYSPRFEDIGMTRQQAGFSYSLPPNEVTSEVFNARSILNDKKTLVAGQTLYFSQLDSRFYISAAAPVSEINAEGTRIMFFVIAAIFIFIILIAIYLYYFIGKLTEPVIKFTNSTRAIAKGNFSVRITEDYKDEFAVLKDSMNLMAERIGNSLNVLQNILNGIDSFVYVMEPDTGKILFANEPMRKGMLFTKDIIGQFCYDVFGKNEKEMCDFCSCCRFDKEKEKNIIWEQYNPVTKRYYLNTDVLIEWIEGDQVHLRHSVDITDLKTIMEEKTLAEERSRTKSAFLANMSHEIRTPMNSVIGFSELALDDKISQKTKNYLTNILENSKWLLHIIDDILDISKIEAGKYELENIPFDLRELFSACRVMITPKAEAKGIHLHFYAEPSVGKVLLGDPTKLRQVIANLLSNAVKFTSSGIVKILSVIKNYDENSTTMYFEIKDSGIGMSPEQLERIFDPFTQAESGTTRKYGGTGLGLAITKSIIEMMGGKLLVESTLGVGSKFSFEVTFDTIDANEKNTQKIIFDEMKKPNFEGEILLFEDNTMNQQVICEHLARVGLKTTVAQNGKIGVEILQKRIENNEKLFDLIFMDIHMPVMDGLEAAELIRSLDTGIPVVALTANIMSHDRELYESKGMSEHVSKPFTSQELWRCLMKYFSPTHWKTDEKNLRAEEELKQKLINNFVYSNKNKFSEIESAISSGHIKLAHRLAHTLKSNAAQLKKSRLQEAADDIENALKDGKNYVTSQQMASLKNELSVALEEFASQLHEQTASDETKNSAEIKNLLDELEHGLKNGDADCLKFVADLRSVPNSDALILHMENFDFALASEALARLKNNVSK